jgi:hypothetical protein
VASHASKNYEDTNNRVTINVGLCSGLFAATAVASAQCVSALVPLGVQVVLMAFRTGTYAQSIAERLSPTTSDSSESWTHIYAGVKDVQASAALDAFHDAYVNALFLHYRTDNLVLLLPLKTGH